MTKIIIDNNTRAKFHDFKETLQFVDESGRLLGLFTPAVDSALLQPQIDENEIARRVQQGGGRPLEEIMRELEKRA